MRNFHLLAAALLFTFLACERVPAAVIVDVQDARLDVGQVGFVNVLISGTNDTIGLFNYEFAIGNAGANVGSLRFSEPQLTDAMDPNYIFAGDSGGFVSVPQNGAVADSIVGGDFAGSFANVDLTTARLMIRLDVEHVIPMGTDTSLAETDVFTISLQNTASTFFADSTFTMPAQIDDDSFDALGSGTVSFTATSVPEPSTAILLVAGLAPVALRRRRS